MQIIEGLDYYPNFLSNDQIKKINYDIQKGLESAPFFRPTMPKTGKEFSVKMTNMGKYGWVSDQAEGYRYQDYHPVTKNKWQPISDSILHIWQEITSLKTTPDCCLVNYYGLNAKMGLHVDNDEKDFSYPVLSISLGAPALFRFGGLKRSDKTKSIKLNNADIIMISGKSRLIYHGISKIYQDSKFDHRINLTLRKI